MNSPRRMIFFGAHPDDESFGLGGTLAHYAMQGVEVVYVCATRGEVGQAEAEDLEGFADAAEMRSTELTCAAKELGLADVIYLGYRDSGMPGSPDNQHPRALAAAPPDQVTAKVVKILRDLKPQVVITFDPIGGYRHPDHIAIHNATVHAFHAAGDPQQYAGLGSPLPKGLPQRLYYVVFGRRLLRLAVWIMPLLGRDPRRFGRNGDIDLTSLARVDFPTHARIRISGQAAERKLRAAACHKSQLESGPPASGVLGWITKTMGNVEQFMRAYPPVPDGTRGIEKDLFG